MTRPDQCQHAGCARPIARRQFCDGHYSVHRQRQISLGTWRSTFVDARACQQHLRRLVEAGMTLRQVAARLEVTNDCVQRIHNHPGTGRFVVRRDIAKRLAAIDLPSVYTTYLHAPDTAMVNGVGSRRRLQALGAAGWPQTELAARLGWTSVYLSYFVTHPERGLNAGMARKIAALFDELQLVPGPSKRARDAALRRGWVPALAWEEEDIDHPDAQPYSGSSEPDDGYVDEILVERCVMAWRNNTTPPQVPRREKPAVARALLTAGAGRHYTSSLLGWTGPYMDNKLAA